MDEILFCSECKETIIDDNMKLCECDYAICLKCYSKQKWEEWECFMCDECRKECHKCLEKCSQMKQKIQLRYHQIKKQIQLEYWEGRQKRKQKRKQENIKLNSSKKQK